MPCGPPSLASASHWGVWRAQPLHSLSRVYPWQWRQWQQLAAVGALELALAGPGLEARKRRHPPSPVALGWLGGELARPPLIPSQVPGPRPGPVPPSTAEAPLPSAVPDLPLPLSWHASEVQGPLGPAARLFAVPSGMPALQSSVIGCPAALQHFRPREEEETERPPSVMTLRSPWLHLMHRPTARHPRCSPCAAQNYALVSE
mmetsp:Transcript_38561/g.96805  ORF Transcript_38561/g.96805 Transcript_38561/m.96805 type:complete len:203 (+) Transcript_38561:716-1324(+)